MCSLQPNPYLPFLIIFAISWYDRSKVLYVTCLPVKYYFVVHLKEQDSGMEDLAHQDSFLDLKDMATLI